MSILDRPARRKGSVTRRAIERFRVVDGAAVARPARDALATEEPLEIRVAAAGGPPVPASVTMRTPGADFELAAGFLYGEGVVETRADVLAMRYCVDGPQRYNRLTVDLASAGRVPARSSYTTAACGVCGKSSIEEVLSLGVGPVEEGPRVTPETLLSLPSRLRGTQKLFDSTGGLHAAALFDPSGRLLRVREDVGRHNAMDKLVGASLLDGELPLSGRIVLASGRLGFELVQKAARAGVPILCAVSAPSSLAVELAGAVGMTLVGFLREGSFNVYSGGHRVLATRGIPYTGVQT
jgi:FdhD protein